MPFSSCFHMHTQIIHIIICYLCHAAVNLKNAQREDFKFYLGQNEHCSPGDSTPYCSEKLLQRGTGKGQCICDFGKGGVHAIKHIL